MPRTFAGARIRTGLFDRRHSAAPIARLTTTKPSALSPCSAASRRAKPNRPRSEIWMRRIAVASRSSGGHTQRFEDAPAAVGQCSGPIVETRLPERAERMGLDQDDVERKLGQRQRERRADETAAADATSHLCTPVAIHLTLDGVRSFGRPAVSTSLPVPSPRRRPRCAHRCSTSASQRPSSPREYARLDRQRHAGLQHAPLLADLVVADVVHVHAEPVAGAMHEEAPVGPLLDQRRHLALEDAELHQALRDRAHRGVVRLVPVIAGLRLGDRSVLRVQHPS